MCVCVCETNSKYIIKSHEHKELSPLQTIHLFASENSILFIILCAIKYEEQLNNKVLNRNKSL